MKKRIITESDIFKFKNYIQNEEKRANTIEKYIRDVKAFSVYANGAEITREVVIGYKNKLLDGNYTARSINSMMSSINSLFYFLGWKDLKVKALKIQHQIYCCKEKNLQKPNISVFVTPASKRGING